MGQRVFLILILFAVPLVAFGVARAIESKYDADWRSALQQEFGELTAEQTEALSLRRLCANPEAALKLGETCSYYNFSSLLERGAQVPGAFCFSFPSQWHISL